MIGFFAGAMIGGAMVLAAVAMVLKTTNDDVYKTEFDFDPWEEDEFWDDYHRNI